MIGKAPVIAFAAITLASAPLAASPTKQSDEEVKKLLVLMDKDKSGKVSREEFMAFMSAEFDRLDVNKDGELDTEELAKLQVRSRSHTGGAGSK